MVYGIWLSADGLSSQQVRQEVLANNLAQVDTPGFKADRVAFSERMNESLLRGNQPSTQYAGFDNATGGLFPTQIYTSYEQGRFIPTSSKLDLALQGAGFLSVGTAEGTRFTRDGRLTVDAEGALLHVASGGRVLDEGGRPIVLDPQRIGDISIDGRGRIQQGQTLVGQLGVVDFENPQELEKSGENLVAADNARRIPANANVRQGMIEASGVDPTLSMVDMIAATRAYEMGASMIRLQDESLGRVVNDVGRIA
ncbi:MAG: flagellar hook-basal body protein [Phycisphaerales bacterium]|nr:flagellar hook-basal body protein [Phycisphaerales bacterium]MCB9862538.1 flagellar hook-basal body protein [Phycisphaerales bacterium]